jgi:hypothetical protein
MGHADFRTGGKIFASMGAPNNDRGMVKLTPEQQQEFCNKDDGCFQPCNGAWGRQGCTNVRLATATTTVVRSALRLAVGNVATKKTRKTTMTIKRESAKRMNNQAKSP